MWFHKQTAFTGSSKKIPQLYSHCIFFALKFSVRFPTKGRRLERARRSASDAEPADDFFNLRSIP